MCPPMGQAKKESLKIREKPSDEIPDNDVDLVLPSLVVEGELSQRVLHEVEKDIDISFTEAEQSVLVCPIKGWELR